MGFVICFGVNFRIAVPSEEILIDNCKRKKMLDDQKVFGERGELFYISRGLNLYQAV